MHAEPPEQDAAEAEGYVDPFADLAEDYDALSSAVYEEVLGEFQAVLDQLAAEDPEFKCEMSVSDAAALKEGYLHLPFETPDDHPVVTSLQAAYKTATGEDAVIGSAPYWTDGGLLANYGPKYPCVIMGPDAPNAHTNEEFIAVASLPKTALIYALAALEFCNE